MPVSLPPLTVSYTCPRWLPEWAVPEVPVPESNTHDLGIEYLRSVLLAWVARSGRHPMVARNLGLRWVKEEPRCGFDPDLCLIEPTPPEAHLSTLRLWEPGHVAPWLAIEVVSPGHPYKDYMDTPERCAAAGVGELWIFDPLMAGPKRTGGPFALQVWQRDGNTMSRVHASNAPGYSRSLKAWLHPTTVKQGPHSGDATPDGALGKLRLSDAEVGGSFWPTLAEQQREAAEQQREAAEQQLKRERARIERLEAELRAARADKR